MTLLRLLPRFVQAYASLDALAAREEWSRSTIEAYQLERLNTLWQHASRFVVHYREMAQRAQLPERFASLNEFRSLVPVLAKETVRNQPGRFLSARAERGHWEQTSGSTGMPTAVYWGHRAHCEHLRSRYRHLSRWGIDFLDRTVFLWGAGTSFPRSITGQLARVRCRVEDRLRNRLRLSARDLSRARLRSHLQTLAAFRPVSLYGFSTAIYLLARVAEEDGFHCDSLRLVTLTAELSPPAFIATAERAFGVPAVREYGSMECGALADEAPDRTLRVHDDVVLVETLPRAEGTFDVIVTVLNNPSFPLIRYAIGDLTDTAARRNDRGFTILGNPTGRDCDVVLTRSGRLLHPELVERLLYEHRNVRRWKLVQALDGSLAVQVEPTDPDRPPDSRRLADELAALVEGYRVDVSVVNAIHSGAGGKSRVIASELGRQFRDARRPAPV